MPISPFYQALRDRIGSDLLLVAAVAAVIRDDQGQILLQQRPDDSWSLPAGAIEPGETPAQAVRREVLEETGLMVYVARILAVVGGTECRVRYRNGDEVEYVVTVFECTAMEKVREPDDEETKRLSYFPADAMPPLLLPYPPEVFEDGRDAPFFTPMIGFPCRS